MSFEVLKIYTQMLCITTFQVIVSGHSFLLTVITLDPAIGL